MKKTRILVAFVLAMMMVFSIGLVACNRDNGHTHTFSEAWDGMDATYHWHKATCEHTDMMSGRAKHTINSLGLCTVCGYDVHNVDVGELLPYADGTVLRMAAGYNSGDTGITFSADVAKDGGVKLANGKTYNPGDLKPTWVQISNNMKITFEDKYSGKKAEKEYEYWVDANRTGEIDILSGTATLLQDGGTKGLFVNLADYLDKMPNFKAYLDANPIVRLSITGDTSTGAIYFSPYFDGVDDIERYPLIRVDMVEALLNGSNDYSGANRNLASAEYKPYMPTSGQVVVSSLNADGTQVVDITKDYAKGGNIIAKMNDALSKGTLSGNDAVKMFRKYIDETYNGLYGEKRADLFLGYNAAWDADELVALLRCAVASLNDNDGAAISGLYSRETENTQREIDLFRFGGSLFGVRGMESRSDYLYFDKEGKLHDARQEVSTYEALERMNAMKKEGLIAMETSVSSDNRLFKDQGIVSYDYCQTQTVYNDTKLNGAGNRTTDTGEAYTVMMVPVAKWFDGTNDNGVWMRFTESWRSVKTEGWGISVAGVAGNQDKLNAALALIDFAFSVQGQITMSYGPDEFIQVKDASVQVKTWADVEKKYVTEDFNGQQWPKVTTEMLADLKAKVGGSYTDYARQYLGSTLNGFPKSQAFEYQCTHEVGRIGAAKVSAAIAKGTINHPFLSVNSDNMWYTIVPTTLPHTQGENGKLNDYKELAGSTNWSTSKGGKNLFLEIIKSGWSNSLVTSVNSAAETANLVKTTWMGTQYLMVKQDAWDRLLAYYNSLNLG